MITPIDINIYIYNLVLFSPYEHIYYVFLNQGHFLFWKQQSIIQMVLNKIIKKIGHKDIYFNNIFRFGKIAYRYCIVKQDSL